MQTRLRFIYMKAIWIDDDYQENETNQVAVIQKKLEKYLVLLYREIAIKRDIVLPSDRQRWAVQIRLLS